MSVSNIFMIILIGFSFVHGSASAESSSALLDATLDQMQIRHQLKTEITQRFHHEMPASKIQIQNMVHDVLKNELSSKQSNIRLLHDLQSYLKYYEEKQNIGTAEVRARTETLIKEKMADVYFENPRNFLNDKETPKVMSLDRWQSRIKTMSPSAQYQYLEEELEAYKNHPAHEAFLSHVRGYFLKAVKDPKENLILISEIIKNFDEVWKGEISFEETSKLFKSISENISSLPPEAAAQYLKTPKDAPLNLKIYIEASKEGILPRDWFLIDELARVSESSYFSSAYFSANSLSDILHPLDAIHPMRFTGKEKGLQRQINKMVELNQDNLGSWLYSKLLKDSPDYAESISNQFYSKEFFPNYFGVGEKGRIVTDRKKIGKTFWNDQEVSHSLLEHYYQTKNPEEIEKFLKMLRNAEMKDILPFASVILKHEPTNSYLGNWIKFNQSLAKHPIINNLEHFENIIKEDAELKKLFSSHLISVLKEPHFTQAMLQDERLVSFLKKGDFSSVLDLNKADQKKLYEKFLSHLEKPLTIPSMYDGTIFQEMKPLALSCYENVAKEYFKLNSDPKTIKSIAKNIGNVYQEIAEVIESDPKAYRKMQKEVSRRRQTFFQLVEGILPKQSQEVTTQLKTQSDLFYDTIPQEDIKGQTCSRQFQSLLRGIFSYHSN